MHTYNKAFTVARPRRLNPPPTVLRGHSQDLRRTDEKILGYPPTPNPLGLATGRNNKNIITTTLNNSKLQDSYTHNGRLI